jgi:hypothetical protein
MGEKGKFLLIQQLALHRRPATAVAALGWVREWKFVYRSVIGKFDTFDCFKFLNGLIYDKID